MQASSFCVCPPVPTGKVDNNKLASHVRQETMASTIANLRSFTPLFLKGQLRCTMPYAICHALSGNINLQCMLRGTVPF